MKHLFIALSTKGYGETILGIRIARELHALGEKCFFLVHESAVSLLVDTPFQHMKFSDHAIGLLKMTLLVLMNKVKPDSIFLCDYFTTDLAFSRAGIEPTMLEKFGVPVSAIDTWDLRRSGTTIDVFGVERRHFEDWADLLHCRIIPVPIAKRCPDPGAAYYCCLPEPSEISRKVRRHIRRGLGIGEDERAVLFCTAGWQHALFNNDHANRLARMLPELIAAYVGKFGPKVHLVHVGPAAYPNALGDRYHWLPPMSPKGFDRVLRSVDLLLSANASSTTIAKALVSGIPSVVLMNPHSISSLEDLQRRTYCEIPTEVASWVRNAAPIFPFYMWPIGYYEFLQPLLRNNEYCDVVSTLEVLQQSRVVNELGALLFDSGLRDERLRQQMRYVSELRELPAAGSLASTLTVHT